MSNTAQKIIEGCKNNDANAQMQFYDMYCKPVYNCCLRILQKTTEAEDAMQESFLKAFGKIDTIGDAPSEAWLRRIAINTSVDVLKKKKKIKFTEPNAGLQIAEDEPYDEEETDRKVNRVKQAIKLLPDGQRMILTLHLIDGFDYEEISKILNIKQGTARAQFTRARQKLAESLKYKIYATG